MTSSKPLQENTSASKKQEATPSVVGDAPPNVDPDNKLIRKKSVWSVHDDLMEIDAQYQRMTPEEKAKFSESFSRNCRYLGFLIHCVAS